MKTYVITLSQKFMKGHPRAGEPTDFEAKFVNAISLGRICINASVKEQKIHTIRANYDLWKKRIEEIQKGYACLSIRLWSGKPYKSKQIEIARLTGEDGVGIQLLQKHEHIAMRTYYTADINRVLDTNKLANNDGLLLEDWEAWFKNAYGRYAIIHFTPFRY